MPVLLFLSYQIAKNYCIKLGFTPKPVVPDYDDFISKNRDWIIEKAKKFAQMAEITIENFDKILYTEGDLPF